MNQFKSVLLPPMSKYITPGEFVDGKKCEVISRKVVWKGLGRDPLTNSIMTLYELSRNCTVEITQEHGEDVERVPNVHYLVGDMLEAGAIRLWVDTKRNNVDFEVKEGVTATHGASIAHTKKRTIGQIKYLRSCSNSFGYEEKPKLKSR